MQSNGFGSLLRLEREARGIKAAYVAYRLGVSPGTYSQIERQKRGLSVDRLLEILAILEVTPKDFWAKVMVEIDKRKQAIG